MNDDMLKLKALLPHWIEHNEEHIRDTGKWLERAREAGLEDVARDLERAIESLREANERIKSATKRMEGRA